MRIRLTLFCLLAAITAFAQQKSDLKYLNQKPPSLKPEIFAPGIISKDGIYEFGSFFNKASTEFFYAVNVKGKEEIRYSKLEGGSWSEPVTLLDDQGYGCNDPFLSSDEQKLYFISRRPIEGEGKLKDYDIWYVKRTNEGWSEPVNAGANINSEGHEYYISFTNQGDMYFSSNKGGSSHDIYKSEYVGGEFQKPVRLGEAVNTSHYEADVFVSPDESYIIFCATRPEGFGEGDLYISFRNEEGAWSKAKNMGREINSKDHELCPFVTSDGKYFFYTSNKGIYWVDAQVIEHLRD